jgi:hypothetical protein
MNNAVAPEHQPIANAYDHIIVGTEVSVSVVAEELSISGTTSLVIGLGSADFVSTISNPSIWFYNMPTPLNHAMPFKSASESTSQPVRKQLVS